MNSMTNDDVYAVVDEEGHTGMYDAVRKTVSRAVDRTVYGSVHDAVDEALYMAVRRSADNFEHPNLNEFLEEARCLR
jgi:ribosomal protein S9